MVLEKKLVVVGDENSGKTCLVMTMCDVEWEVGYEPRVYEGAMKDILVDEEVIRLSLRDMPGHSDYDRLRPFSYPETDVILLCFAVDNPSSLQNIRQKWKPEIDRFCRPGIPLILVGNKCDMRNDSESGSEVKFVDAAQGKKMAKQIKALRYLECSTKTKENVQTVLNEALQVALHKPCEKSNCTVV